MRGTMLLAGLLILLGLTMIVIGVRGRLPQVMEALR